MHAQMQIVQEGAALAPGWTEAMFHELLDQEASPASGAALHHAADIMSLHDTAKAHHCMAGMQQTISGGVLLLRHAHSPLPKPGTATCACSRPSLIALLGRFSNALSLIWYKQALTKKRQASGCRNLYLIVCCFASYD